jgi:molybdenum cofactor cytidylyltransferase
LVLLAAGSSTRIGAPKQLLAYRGMTLLRRAAEAALATVCRPVVVVIGSDAEEMLEELSGLAVEIVANSEWAQGIGSSIRWGIQSLLVDRHEELDGAIIMLCDQPLITADSIDSLVAAFDPGRIDIVASQYESSVGVPALFARSLFDALTRLRADRGAKSLIVGHTGPVVRIPMPAATDIDTQADYDALLRAE